MSGRIIIGDALEQLRKLPDESVDSAISSPPYWGLRDYGTGTWVGGQKDCNHENVNARRDHSRAKMKGTRGTRGTQGSAKASATPMRSTCSRCGARRRDKQIGLERTPDQYIAKIVTVFREVRRVLKKNGTLWLNLGDCYASGAGKVGTAPGGGKQGARWAGDANRIRDDKRGYRGERLPNGHGVAPAVYSVKTRALRDGSHAGKNGAMAALGPMTQPNRMPIHGLKPKDMVGIPWRIAFALQADGWWLRSDIIWHKPQPMPESVRDRPTRAHEYLFLLTKSGRYHYDGDAIKEPATGEAHPRRAMIKDGKNETAAASRPGTFAKRTKVGFNNRWRVRANASFQAATPDLVATRNKRSVWSIPTQQNPDAHFASFPEDLVVPCVLAGCPAGGVVLDPFAGTGTVARVAEDLGRDWLLIELNPKYAAMAKKRMRQQGLLSRVVAPAPATKAPEQLAIGEAA